MGNFISSLTPIINLIYMWLKFLRNSIYDIALCQADNSKNTIRFSQLLCLFHLAFTLGIAQHVAKYRDVSSLPTIGFPEQNYIASLKILLLY